MKRTKIIIITLLSAFSIRLSATYAQIPDNYRPNAAIQEKYDKIINEIFVQIQAQSQIGQTIPPSVFAELYDLFDDIIPHLPNTYSFNIIYQQCLSLSQTLAGWYNLNTLGSFMDNCFKPFIQTVEEINRNHTIKASATVSPSTGPAPLTVTLDARGSSDPSNQTIPNDNFFRYYRDIDGIDRTIGRGNVINYTFQEEGNYRLHLTVRSSNQVMQGILDGSQILSVDVSPRSANIVAFANGQRLRTTQTLKLWLQEWQQGIVFDWSPTTPRGGRVLTRHRRNITWPNGFSAVQDNDGSPEAISVVLPHQWEYTVSLTVFDNQNNQLTDTFRLAISDPVAIIKQTPEVGNTSTRFQFDAWASFGITAAIRLFTWEIFDAQGTRIDTLQWSSIARQFRRPGNYTVRLTVTDENGEENRDTRQILVESTPPIAQFLITPRADILHPSEFVLDARPSYDLDVENGFDSLRYSRSFSHPDTVITQSQDNGQIVHVTFNQRGNHTATLTVTDDFGKSHSITKDFDIKSTLRPDIIVNPQSSTWGTEIQMLAQSNQTILWYERDFWDGNRRTTQSNSTNHTYQSVWVYTTKLRVYNNQEENEVRALVFIGEKDSPIPWYSVENPAINMTMIQNDTCTDDVDGQSIQVPAYTISRYQNVRINANRSVNIRWESSWLRMFFQPRNDQIFTDQWWSFTYRFNDLWCQFVNLTVEDQSVGKVSAVKIWFRVVNALPTVDNLTLSYPQFGNASGIWFQEASAMPQDIFSNEYDPLIVRVSAVNPRDPDGTISYFQRYYYDKNDPNRILATKISPWDVPHTFFSVPRMPWEFMFGVKIYDNDGWSQRSEDVIGNGPVVFFPPDTNRPDIPIVTLRVDKNHVNVGEEITFDILSRVLSERSDFVQERVIQIDFNGDGERDLTTKSDRITYAYTQPNEQWFTPRVSVVYRGYRWVAQGETIIVRNMLRPRLLFDSNDTMLLVRDVSLWNIERQSICMDTRKCNDPDYVKTDRDEWFVFYYPEAGRYVVTMDVFDTNANSATQRRPVQITENNDILQIASIPSMDTTNEVPEIFVWQNLDNSVLFYISYNDPNGVCYVDVNIAIDSENSWNPAQNRDIACNTIHLQSYRPSYQSITGRVYFEEGWLLQTQDFVVSFLDFELTLDERTKEVYTLINKLMASIDPALWNNQRLINELNALKHSILDKNEVSAIIVSIENTIETEDIILSEWEKEHMRQLIQLLENRSTVAAVGWSEYEQAKAEIISIVPQNIAGDVRLLFQEFENARWSETQTIQEAQKNILQQIIDFVGWHVAEPGTAIQENQIDSRDMQNIIIPNICKITEFYGIPTDSCIYDEDSPVAIIPTDVTQTTWSSGLAWWIRVLLIVIWVLVVGFVWLIILFAIKAKMKLNNPDNQESDEYIVPQEVAQPETAAEPQQETQSNDNQASQTQANNSESQNTNQ